MLQSIEDHSGRGE